MKVNIPGHNYELDSFEGTNPQTLQFIQKEMKDGTFQTVHDGTTNEEVIKMLQNRIIHLNNKCSCPENEAALHYLGLALFSLEERTRNRKAQNVEGTPLNHTNPVIGDYDIPGVKSASEHKNYSDDQPTTNEC